MAANLDFDLIVHLGYLENVDLSQTGIYVVQVTLMYGEDGTRIAPVGLFSAPSKLESTIGPQRIPAARLCSMCEVEDTSKTFRSRSIVVRYKDEKHELNDGCHWRFTVPIQNMHAFMDASDDSLPAHEHKQQKSIHCTEFLHLRFELLYTSLLDNDGTVDLMRDIDSVLPDDPEFEIVASQNIVLQQANSGVQQYFPLHFDSLYRVNLDCMVHCCITAVDYKDIEDTVLSFSQTGTGTGTAHMKIAAIHKHSDGGEGGDDGSDGDSAVATQPRTQVDTQQQPPPSPPLPPTAAAAAVRFTPGKVSESTVIDPTTARTQQDRRALVGTTIDSKNRSSNSNSELLLSPPVSPKSRTLNGSANKDTLTAVSVSGFTSSTQAEENGRSAEDRLMASCGLREVDIERLFDMFAAPVILNFNLAVSTTSSVVAMYASKKEAKEGIIVSDSRGRNKSNDTNDAAIEHRLVDSCLLETEREELLTELCSISTIDDLCSALREKIDICNAQVALRWALVWTSLRRVFELMLAHTRPRYELAIRQFWARQSLLHIKSVFGTQRYMRSEEEQLFTALTSLIRTERNEQLWAYRKHIQRLSDLGGTSASIYSNNALSRNPSHEPMSDSATIQGTLKSAVFENNVLELDGTKGTTATHLSARRTGMLARNLCLFDLDMHFYFEKLPQIVVEQYVSVPRSLDRATTNEKDQLDYVERSAKRGAHAGAVFDTGFQTGTVGLFHGAQLHVPGTDKGRSCGIERDGISGGGIDLLDELSGSRSVSQSYSTDRCSSSSSSGSSIPQAKDISLLLSRAMKATAPSSFSFAAALSGEHSFSPPASASTSASSSSSSRGQEDAAPLTTTTEDTASSAASSSASASASASSSASASASSSSSSSALLSSMVSITDRFKSTVSSQASRLSLRLGPTAGEGTDEASAASEAPVTAVSNDIIGDRTESSFRHHIAANPNVVMAAAHTAAVGHDDQIERKKLDTELNSGSGKEMKKLRTRVRRGDYGYDDDDNDETVHLVVLLHGFLGTSYDMRLLETYMRLVLPSSEQEKMGGKKVQMMYWSPDCNEISIPAERAGAATEADSIMQMAKRFAFELLTYCKTQFKASSPHSRISFIAHSMGGLVIRAALQEPMLKPLLPKLHTYISLATPHLGTTHAESSLVSTGMWALFKLKKCKSLKELVLEDAIGGKTKKSLLYKLSENGVLAYFHKVVLVSSPKDQYVPSHSARIQINSKIEADAASADAAGSSSFTFTDRPGTSSIIMASVMGAFGIGGGVGGASNSSTAATEKEKRRDALASVLVDMTRNILQQFRADQVVRVSVDNNVGEAVNVNTVIGRAAHISFLENDAVVQQLVLTLAPYLML